MQGYLKLLSLVFTFLLLGSTSVVANEIMLPKDRDSNVHRWMGYDFVFCFVTDDGKLSNLAWADVGRELDFRFTMAVNPYNEPDWNTLSSSQLHELWVDGFEIANHSYSHGQLGLPESCLMPPRGSMAGYYECEGIDPDQAMTDFIREIERDSVATIANIPSQDVKSFAYPRHIHTFAIIDSLIAEGYTGARMGSQWSEEEYSYGDFTTYPKNSWDDGLSLFRIPVKTVSRNLFGNHSASPPVHYTYEEFVEAAQPHINQMRNSGGAFLLYSHHLGNDDDSLGDINYSAGGVSAEDLGWIVELVRANGGLVMTFGEMCSYYRERSTMVEISGDYVWMPRTTSVENIQPPSIFELRNFPNPFNPRTIISFSLKEDSFVDVGIYNQAGKLEKVLAGDHFSRGVHKLGWNGVNQVGVPVSAGLYFLRIEANGMSESRKLVLIK